MRFIIGIIGIALSVYMVVKREMFGDMFGEPEWTQKVGGIYNVMVICALLVFFWSIAYMTGTISVLLRPIIGLFFLGKAP